MSEAVVASPVELPGAGDEELVFEQLYRENRDDLYAYVAGVLRDRGAAEEVMARRHSSSRQRALD